MHRVWPWNLWMRAVAIVIILEWKKAKEGMNKKGQGVMPGVG